MNTDAIQRLKKIDKNRYRIPREYKPGMLTDGMIYASEQLLPDILKDKALEQVANVAFLPGIVKQSLAMPDIHWGYGFPIGGVVATDIDKGGVISPGGVGFDINCGVRLLKTSLIFEEIKQKIPELADLLYHVVPAGVGSKGRIKLKDKDEKKLLIGGAKWAVRQGFGTREDLENTEEKGQLANADDGTISLKALERGRSQAGTLGSGNHFLEVQAIDTIFDAEVAAELGLFVGQVTIMIHTGSRGFGHQICTDHLKIMQNCLRKYDIMVPDRQLACAPVKSQEGQDYLAAMAAAANYAWANRQILMHNTRLAFEKIFKVGQNSLKMDLIYDVAHNIAKIEVHNVDGIPKRLCVHRKGATRAFGPLSEALPERYQKIGQPVVIPGDMGRHSYLLAGTQKAMEETFGSTCHGAGRLKSRSEAIRTFNKKQVLRELSNKGIVVRATGRDIIAEEAPMAYKDVNEVVGVVHSAAISRKICRMRPVAVIKG